MEQPKKRRWDPDCPKCREELRRHIELWEAVYEEVDHGVVKGAPFGYDDLSCDHEKDQKP